MSDRNRIKSVAIIGAGAAGTNSLTSSTHSRYIINHAEFQALPRLLRSMQRTTLSEFEFLSAGKHLVEHGKLLC